MESEKQNVTLRPATEADALCLGVLATQVFLDTYAFAGITDEVATEVRTAFATDAFRDTLTRSSTFVTIAERGEALVGFAQSTIGVAHPLAPTGSQAELDRLYVQEPFVRQGIGSLLLKNHEALTANRGVSVLWLSPWIGNHRALRFYAKHGYRDYGLVYFQMGQSKIENRVYAKRLPSFIQHLG